MIVNLSRENGRRNDFYSQTKSYPHIHSPLLLLLRLKKYVDNHPVDKEKPKSMTAPLKLKRLFKENGQNYRAVARAVNVNVYWVIHVLKGTKEPKNKAIRRALFLPDHPRKPRQKGTRVPPPDHLRWWRRLKKAERDAIIRQTYDWIKE
jgi:hypothetical protein